MFNEKDQLAIDTIRALSIDAIEKANSGHPGLPMGAAPMAYTLWTRHLNFNPQSKDFFNRDRFILSAGHGSALLYSLLHVSGSLELEELKQFRQWGSKTPGHPEYRHTDGVEVTTGPLGQGFAMSVGMALAESHLAGKFNKDQFDIVNHYTYVLASDGDLMEGISHEAASFAGHNQLDKLIVLYDSNDISLDGDLDKSFSEDTKQRFEAYGWNYILVENGNDLDEIDNAITQAKSQQGPTIIEVKTIIGFGSPNKAGSNGVHGAPLGEEERALTFKEYGLDPEKRFNVPEDVYEIFKSTMLKRANENEEAWNNMLKNYSEAYPELAEEFKLAMSGKLPNNYADALPEYDLNHSGASRADSGEIIQKLSEFVPSFFGGSADLAGSNKSNVKEAKDYNKDTPEGKNVWFGVREFAMGAAINGMAAHGGLHPYAATFFVFSDYLKPALRLSSIMGLNSTFIFTHDSIAVGEDGPTHEPIEQLAGLRAIPNMNVIRPADGNETRVAWEVALESEHTPTSLVLTRQNLPTLDVDKQTVENGVRKGAYIVFETEQQLEYLLLASGSEVNLAVEAAKELEQQGKGVRVISMPNWYAFEQQSSEYKESILPSDVTKRIAIEMASPLGWHKYVGIEGKVIGINSFGASAPGDLVVEKYGFTKENILKQVRSL
ncbi:transketolase [Staphylococcus epidermidis]|jgi:transketolase|uniref:Transketolase n=3 Tax=Staphylococcus TaxID=1279 RepID=TKT_STAES|nr:MULTISPECIES: transketolase [Staphylococcus]Q8CPC7.1 RecName: Full=Transketolase; Short=TK [Staphylococcus epidermidis ATCC 12228]EHQ76323.1 transketolase [Staphylococcus epidermidis VCU057]EID35533.1 transketolase [Staphylococcus epidermidis IS-250]EJD82523.1 transketolase [Staphylococcus epidermidis NIHLM088]EJD88598.1 transketolase [Staphylococcus epidermidis NIHLM070]CVZ06154.1 transketolase [Streptococcus pneumoniae]